MALPEIVAPAGTRPFLAAGHSVVEDSPYAQVAMRTGHARTRRVWTVAERVVSVRWYLDADQVPVVRAWFEETLLQASLPFAAYIRNLGPGMLFVRARWISYEWEMMHLGRAIVSGSLFVWEEADPPVALLSIGWADPVGNNPSSVAHANAGSATWAIDASDQWWLGVVDFAGGFVVWSLEWTPTGADPSPTLDQPFGTGDFRGRISWPSLGPNQTSEGLLRVTATVGGVSTDAIVAASGAANYNSMSWGPE